MTAIAQLPLSTLSTSPTSFPGGWLPVHPDIEKVTVRLRMTHRRKFPFLHGGVIHGLLCRLFDHQLPPGLLPWSPESGRIFYEAGDSYLFSLALLGPAQRRADEIGSHLQEVATQPWRRQNRKVLGGNFLVEEIVRERALLLPPGDELETFTLSSQPVCLRFISPLRLKRPRELTLAGAGFLDHDCFPAAHFLRRLYQRWQFLQRGEYPRPSEIPEPPSDAAAKPRRLLWLDLPVIGSNAKKRMTLGGVLGEVELSGLTPPWRRLLAAMQSLHAGACTHYGLGRYVIDTLSKPRPAAPASCHLATLASRRSLAEAADREGRRGGAGADGETPRSYLAAGASRLDDLAQELRTGSYCPDPLSLVDGHAVPTVRDRIVQRALVEQLREPMQEVRRLRRRDAKSDQTPTADDLSVLFPSEPAGQLVSSFLEAPIHQNGRRVESPSALPIISPLNELFPAIRRDRSGPQAGGRVTDRRPAVHHPR